ncbi:DeoR/GlpR family DNA-binding transcription regulator [Lacticaseibacillus saniviri]
MLTEERHQHILATLKRQGVVKLKDLMTELNASESTIRRDLADLEDAGLLERIHGGAKRSQSLAAEPSVSEKATQQLPAKQLIAQAASQLVQSGDMIFLDAGTTTAELIPHLAEKDVTVITTGVDNASVLADYNVKVLMLGGLIKPATKAAIGAITTKMLASFRFNWAFLGTNGIHPDFGHTTPDPEEAIVKQLAIQQADHSIILADASKFNRVSFAKFAPLDTVTVFTDHKPHTPAFDACANIKEVPF